ncbi:MAG: type VI secretion system protein IglI family protein [Myxococcota bacterium]|nr:type VI secretion system protein IglI family protein [Myxococcota bacterium]
MSSISLLSEKLETPGTPGLDTLDPRFSQIGDIAQKRDFKGAAELIEGLYRDKLYDIRLAIYHFYYVFETERAQGLNSVAQVLIALFEDNWDVWGPDNKKEKVVSNALTWLFQNCNDLIDYNDSKQDGGWVFSDAAKSDSISEELLASLKALAKIIDAPTYERAATLLASLTRRIDDAYLRRSKEEATMTIPDDETKANSAGPQKVEPESLAQGPSENQITLRASTHLFELQQKLRAFEILVSKGEFQKAAVVSKDVVNLIENFDPRLYFPELFAGFFGSFNRAIEDIRPHLEHRDDMTWQSLEQFYRVDLKGFVDG